MIQKYLGPVRKDPSPLVRESQMFEWCVSSPVRGIRDQSGSGEVVASCWGFASPWPPSPLPDYFPNRWDAVSRVGCLSLGIDSPPFYGPPLCPSDPVLSPHHAKCVSLCRDMSRTCRGVFGEVVEGTESSYPPRLV